MAQKVLKGAKRKPVANGEGRAPSRPPVVLVVGAEVRGYLSAKGE